MNGRVAEHPTAHRLEVFVWLDAGAPILKLGSPSHDLLWSTSVFEFDTDGDAAEVHDRLYGDPMRAAWGTRAMQRARAGGRDAIYRTEVRGTEAWYIDLGRGAHHKELNFVSGPLIFTFGSYVLDANPLRMHNLIRRAERLPGLQRRR
jgi:hypothetical protein